MVTLATKKSLLGMSSCDLLSPKIDNPIGTPIIKHKPTKLQQTITYDREKNISETH